MNAGKDATARDLAAYHSQTESTLQKIVRVRSGNEDSDKEPIKLLEVNTATVPAGIMPVKFGATEDVPFSIVIIEITDREYEEVVSNGLSLPDEWMLGETLFEKG
jgi:hypothetical protein